MEIEENRCLPFLDVLLIRSDDGKLKHTVYRKPTHTNRYLNARSHHPPQQLQGVLRTLVHRAEKVADPEHRKQEEDILKQAFLENGYSKKQIYRAFHPKTCSEEREKPVATAVLPYAQGTTNVIARILKKNNIATRFRPPKKVGQLMRNVKDKIPATNQPGVYSIPCLDCNRVYIGQSGRTVKQRIVEHGRYIKDGKPLSGLAEHAIATGHTVDLDATEMVKIEPNYWPRLITEAVTIHCNPYNMNRDDAYKISNMWGPILRPPGGRNPNKGAAHQLIAPTDDTTYLKSQPPGSAAHQNTTAPRRSERIAEYSRHPSPEDAATGP